MISYCLDESITAALTLAKIKVNTRGIGKENRHEPMTFSNWLLQIRPISLGALPEMTSRLGFVTGWVVLIHSLTWPCKNVEENACRVTYVTNIEPVFQLGEPKEVEAGS
jgi:hypothetical protein